MRAISRIAVALALSAALVMTVHVSAVQASFPGYNGKIAFAGPVGADPNSPDIWTVDPDGSDLINLTSNSPAGDYGPSWSPDGTKIAYSSGYGYTSPPANPGPSPEIFVMGPDGSNRTQVTHKDEVTYFRNAPAWSPDGTRIAFYGSSPTGNNIYVMNADGTNQIQVTQFSGSASPLPPVWSPDGSRLAFHKFDDDQATPDTFEGDIYVVNVDGSSVTNLTPGTVAEDLSPSWSPDGTKLAFSSDRAADRSFDLYTMNADGTEVSLVSKNGGYPEWSPDGSRIAFSCGGVCLIDPDGTDRTKIVTMSPVVDLDWQPCSQQGCTQGPTCPAEECPPLDATLALDVEKVGAQLRSSGMVTPSFPGETVRLTLFKKKDGRFVKQASRSAVLDAESAYAASFKSPGRGSCRVKASLSASEEHESARATWNGKC
jgi:Tol biopolymer transport system component